MLRNCLQSIVGLGAGVSADGWGAAAVDKRLDEWVTADKVSVATAKPQGVEAPPPGLLSVPPITGT